MRSSVFNHWRPRFFVEIGYVWFLVFCRLFGAGLYGICLPPESDYATDYEAAVNTYRLYSYYVPFEVILSVLSLMLCARKISDLGLNRTGLSWLKCVAVVMPLIVASVYSLHWLFISYPSIENKQFRYFYRQYRALEELVDDSAVVNKDKLRDLLLERLKGPSSGKNESVGNSDE